MNIFDLTGAVEYLPAIGAGLERSREINNDISISFAVPQSELNNHVFKMLQNESIIELPTDGQTYRIKKIKKSLKGRRPYKSVTATHVFFDIIDAKIEKEDARTGSYSLKSMFDFVLAPTGWKVELVGSFNNESYENFGGANCLKLFQELIERYTLEFWPDSITKTVIVAKRIGQDTDAQIRYSHNLKTLSEDISTDNLSTKIKCYGKKTTDEEGNVISQVVAVYTSPNVYKYDREIWADDFEDERFTTVETLLGAGEQKIKDEPEVTIEIDYLELKEQGENIHNFDIGDSIFVIHEPLEIDVNARVKKIVDYPFSKGVKQPKLTISNVKKNIKDRIVAANKAAQAAQVTSNNATRIAATAQDAANQATQTAQQTYASAAEAGQAANAATTAAQQAQVAANAANQAAQDAITAANQASGDVGTATTAAQQAQAAAQQAAQDAAEAAQQAAAVTEAVNTLTNKVNSIRYTRERHIIVSDGTQLAITLPFTYSPGENQLDVYFGTTKRLSSSNLPTGLTGDYTETNNNTITLTAAQEAGVYIEIIKASVVFSQ